MAERVVEFSEARFATRSDIAATGQKIMDRAGYLHTPGEVNLDRVAHYLSALHMNAEPHRLIVDAADMPKVEAAISDVVQRPFAANATGEYVSEAGLYVMYRQPGMHRRTVEKGAIHEETHAATAPVVTPGDKTYLPGFMPAKGVRGAFFRESFARWSDENYTHSLDPTPPSVPSDKPGKPLPKYTAGDAYVMGAIGMELLFQHDPELIDVTIEAQSSQGAVEEFEARLHEISPTLFGDLWEITLPLLDEPFPADRMYGRFLKGYQQIKEATGISARSEVDSICEAGASTQWVEDRLRQHEAETGYQFVPTSIDREIAQHANSGSGRA